MAVFVDGWLFTSVPLQGWASVQFMWAGMLTSTYRTSRCFCVHVSAHITRLWSLRARRIRCSGHATCGANTPVATSFGWPSMATLRRIVSQLPRARTRADARPRAFSSRKHLLPCILYHRTASALRVAAFGALLHSGPCLCKAVFIGQLLHSFWRCRKPTSGENHASTCQVYTNTFWTLQAMRDCGR